jgi:hypothetical protein
MIRMSSEDYGKRRIETGEHHVTEIEERGDHFVPACSCGWRGQQAWSRTAAKMYADGHRRAVALGDES